MMSIKGSDWKEEGRKFHWKQLAPSLAKRVDRAPSPTELQSGRNESNEGAPVLFHSSFSSLAQQRLNAVKDLQDKPDDPVLVKKLQFAEEQIRLWAQTRQMPLPEDLVNSRAKQKEATTNSSSSDSKHHSTYLPGYDRKKASSPSPNHKRKRSQSPHNKPDTSSPPRRHNPDRVISRLSIPVENHQSLYQGRQPLPLALPTPPSRYSTSRSSFRTPFIQRKGLLNSRRLTREELTERIQDKHPVSALGELCQIKGWGPPAYACQATGKGGVNVSQSQIHIRSQKPNFNYLWAVKVNGVEYQAEKSCSNKKLAKAQTAQVALIQMGYIKSDQKGKEDKEKKKKVEK